MSRTVLAAAAALLIFGVAGCRTLGGGRPSPSEEVEFDPTHITGDPALAKLNDEELFAQGTSAFAAGDLLRAARLFGRLADFHPDSPHRRPALYRAGLAHQRLKQFEEAAQRFSELADPRGTGDAVDASFRLAESLYHLGRYEEAAELLAVLAGRQDLSIGRRLEAQVQEGICQLEAGRRDAAEASLRRALAAHAALTEVERAEVDDYFPAQAQFFLGEIYRLHYEDVRLDPAAGAEQLAKDLEYKAELLLSSQGHYLRTIRMGNGYWATAAGAQIGGLYESFYDYLVALPAPPELSGEQIDTYRQELRKKVRVLVTKAIGIYERTLEAAERIGSQNAFVKRTRESLRKMKALLLADPEAPLGGESAADDERSAPTPVGPRGGRPSS